LRKKFSLKDMQKIPQMRQKNPPTHRNFTFHKMRQKSPCTFNLYISLELQHTIQLQSISQLILIPQQYHHIQKTHSRQFYSPLCYLINQQTINGCSPAPTASKMTSFDCKIIELERREGAGIGSVKFQ
jgi:hypothetical protein